MCVCFPSCHSCHSVPSPPPPSCSHTVYPSTLTLFLFPSLFPMSHAAVRRVRQCRSLHDGAQPRGLGARHLQGRGHQGLKRRRLLQGHTLLPAGRLMCVRVVREGMSLGTTAWCVGAGCKWCVCVRVGIFQSWPPRGSAGFCWFSTSPTADVPTAPPTGCIHGCCVSGQHGCSALSPDFHPLCLLLPCLVTSPALLLFAATTGAP